MLYDNAKITVQAGRGGDGCISFRREAHVPKGGPDGGDGGRGADVVLICSDSLRDLQGFRRRGQFKADSGGHGQGNQRHGASGETLEIGVPPGTIITTEDGTRYDLTTAGQRAVVAQGGSGGRGNRHFATSTRQAPRFGERGLAGDEGLVTLQLKLLADVGLVGLPNAGKSSLLARLTRAQPKVANYPFTTLEPVLGTLELDDRQLVIADIPGLIEGASEGAGLGHDFLAHIERTRLLVHVLDLAPLDGSDPLENYRVIEAELESHDPRLAALPRILVLSKADLVSPEEADEAAAAWRQRLAANAEEVPEWEPQEELVPVIVTSSATGQAMENLARELVHRVPVVTTSGEVLVGPGANQALPEHQTFRPGSDRGFKVNANDDGGWTVSGEGVERLVARYDLENEEALAHLEGRLRRIGVVRALESAGFKPGDDVEIGGVLFELDPGGPI
ncbi:MAG: GTPase ObgE [Solirubrobacterales bacterium]|nr:GTPase ObgE [Solirubrobacterales bacterium]